MPHIILSVGLLLFLSGGIRPIDAYAQIKLEQVIFGKRSVQLFESLPEPSPNTLQRVLSRINQDVSLRDIQLRLQSGVTTGYIPSWYRSLVDTSQAVMFKSNYRYTDINSDGRTDLVYTGYPLSYDEPYTIIWLKSPSKFELLGQHEGLLYALKPGNPPAFIAQQGQCCGHYVTRYDVVAFTDATDSKTNSRFTTRRSYVAFQNTYLPRGTAPVSGSLPIIIAAERVALRFSPVKRNSMDTVFTNRERMKVFGNIIAVFYQSDGGRLLAKYSESSTGQQWWLVAMGPKTLGSYNRFYNDREAHRIGWIPAESASMDQTSSNLD